MLGLPPAGSRPRADAAVHVIGTSPRVADTNGEGDGDGVLLHPGRPMERTVLTETRRDPLAGALAALMIGAGIGHVVAPRYFRTLVPRWVPAPGLLVAATGLADVAAGALLIRPSTRRAGAIATTLLISGYFTSHIDAALRASPEAGRLLDRPVGTTARIVVNLGYLAWAQSVRRRAADVDLSQA